MEIVPFFKNRKRKGKEKERRWKEKIKKIGEKETKEREKKRWKEAVKCHKKILLSVLLYTIPDFVILIFIYSYVSSMFW